MTYYSNHILAALLLMILTGAARGVCVKLFYQLGFEKPIFVTILFLLGQALSLPAHYVTRWYKAITKKKNVQVKEHVSGNLHHAGSTTGLNARSHEAIQWIHRIPWWAKPAIPGICNLCEATCRFTALVFLPASIAEIIMSGLELIFVVFAARLIRKRLISFERWIGVSIVMVGLILVGGADFIKAGGGGGGGEYSTSTSNQIIGISLVTGKCFTSAIQDLAEEIFVQEANMPATLLMGLEGIFGLVIVIPLYFAIGPAINERPSETIQMFSGDDSAFRISYAVFLVFLFTATSLSQIISTALTSSMTRNMWKNFRGLVAWIASLIIFYASGNDDLGEPWRIPQSFVVLVGFCIMFGGLQYYYQGVQSNNQEDGSVVVVVEEEEEEEEEHGEERTHQQSVPSIMQQDDQSSGTEQSCQRSSS